MTIRLPLAVLAAAIFAAAGPGALLGAAAPASADQDDHHARPAHHHVARSANPYGANGYWRNGAWHYRRATHPGNHYGWNQTHPAHPVRRTPQSWNGDKH